MTEYIARIDGKTVARVDSFPEIRKRAIKALSEHKGNENSVAIFTSAHIAAFPRYIITVDRGNKTVADAIKSGAAIIMIEYDPKTHSLKSTKNLNPDGSPLTKASAKDPIGNSAAIIKKIDAIHGGFHEPGRKYPLTIRADKYTEVRDWYMKAYPMDDLGPEIKKGTTFEDIREYLNLGVDVYPYLADDSIVRERVFEMLAIVFGVHCGVIYDTWLGRGREQRIPSTKKRK